MELKPNENIKKEEPIIKVLKNNKFMSSPFKDLTSKGRPKLTTINMEILFDMEDIVVRYNEMSKEIEINISNFIKLAIETKLECQKRKIKELCMNYDFSSINDNDIEQCLLYIASVNSYHPVKNWLDKSYLKNKEVIDSTYPTIQELLKTIVTTKKQNKLKNKLITKWLVSAIHAIYGNCEMGAKIDGVLTFQGYQGKGKTTWFKNLQPSFLNTSNEWVRDGSNLDPSNKDSINQCIKYWIVELGELGSTLKKDLDRLKAFITQSADEFRPPYGRVLRKYARRTVFGSSVNQDEFLKDETGNRRWWCIHAKDINFEHNINIEMLWCEVLHLYQSGFKWFLNKEEQDELDENNRQYSVIDQDNSLIQSYLEWDSTERYWLKSKDIYFELGSPGRLTISKISRLLKNVLKCEFKIKNGETYYAVPKSRIPRGCWGYPVVEKKEEYLNEDKEFIQTELPF